MTTPLRPLIPARTPKTIRLAAVATFIALVPSSPAADPVLSIEPKGEHRLAVEAGSTVVNIRSERGIGRAKIRSADGKWPARIVLRLHLRGLEHVEISNGAMNLSTSVSSVKAPGRERTTYLTEGPGAAREEIENQIPPGHPLSLEVKIIREEGDGREPAIPLKKGHFEIEIPSAFLESDPPEIRIHWIDFYR